MADRYVRGVENRAERLANPQVPVHTWGGKPVTHSGYILPYGRGGYRHSFGNCGCGCVGCGGMGEDASSGNTVALGVLLGLGALLAYSLL